ncbi:MAG: branched-chain amino acid ABC transporter permease [Bacteroidota bacterium]
MKWKLIIWMLILLALILMPLWQSTANLRLLELMLLSSVACLGLQLKTGQAGLISLGQAGFMALGAYSTAILLQQGWPLLLAMLVGVIIAAVIGGILGLTASRLSGPFLAIVSLAFGIGVSTWIANTDWLGASAGLMVPIPAFLQSENNLYYAVVAVVVFAYLTASFLSRSHWGLIWRAIRDKELLTVHLGINSNLHKSLVFGLGAAFGGLAGGLWAIYLGYLSPASFGFSLSVSLLAGLVFGGQGYLAGAVLGTSLLTLLEQNLLPAGLSGLGWMLEGLLMVIVILAFPRGLWHWIQQLWSSPSS